jgi:hypothetical protein
MRRAMKRQGYLIALLLLPFSHLVWAEKTLVPLRHWIVEGEAGGSVVVFLERSDDGEAMASVAAVETSSGDRARLFSAFDLEEGIATRRIDDLGTGWFAEWRLDTGVRNLPVPGSVGHGSSADWLIQAEELRQRESPGETFTLETADGAFVTWFEPAGTERPSYTGRVEALATLASQLRESPPPASTLRIMRLLGRLIRGEGEAPLSEFDNVIGAIQDALLAAGVEAEASAEDDEVQVEPQRLPLAEQPDRIDALRRQLEAMEAPNEGDTSKPEAGR